MSDPRDPLDEGGDDAELDQAEDLDEPIEDEAEPGEEPEEAVEADEPEPEPRRTRGPRGRANGEEIRELRSQLEQTTRQIEELRRPAPQRVDPAQQQQAEERFFEQLEMMPPREAYKALWQQAQQVLGQRIAQQSSATQEGFDKQAYDARAETSRVRQQYRDRVEALVAMERGRGNIVPRENALRHLYADDMLARADRVAAPQRRAGAARVANQTTRPASGRGDVARAGRRRDQGDDDAALLRQITAGDI
jgi:hypothetical protein